MHKKIKIKCLTPYNSHGLRKFDIHVDGKNIGFIYPNNEEEFSVPVESKFVSVSIDWYHRSICLSEEETSYYFITFDFGSTMFRAFLNSMKKNAIQIYEIPKDSFSSLEENFNKKFEMEKMNQIDWVSMSLISILSFLIILCALYFFKDHEKIAGYSVLMSFSNLIGIIAIILNRKWIRKKGYKYSIFFIAIVLFIFELIIPVPIYYKFGLLTLTILLLIRHWSFIHPNFTKL